MVDDDDEIKFYYFRLSCFVLSSFQLLAPEIRHERNVVLQCVRYIVNNNFFGVGQTTEPTNDAPTSGVPKGKETNNNGDDSEVMEEESGGASQTETVVDEDIWELPSVMAS